MSKTDTKKVVVAKKEVAPEVEPEPVSFFSLFRFATTGDIAYMIFGSLAAIANGAAMPAFSLLLGNMTDALRPGKTADDLVSAAGEDSLYFLYVGIGTWTLSYMSFGFWMISGERQTNRYRSEYFRAILRQDIAYFDKINPSLLTTKVATETFNIQTAIGEKVSTFMYTISMCCSGFIIGYCKGALEALIITAAVPYLSFLGWAFTYVMQQSEKNAKKAYEMAGGFAEQALNAVRTVLGLNGEAKEEKNYTSALEESTKISIRYSYLIALFMGLTFSGFPFVYALGFWFGSVLIEDKYYNTVTMTDYTVGDVLTVFFSITFGAFSLGQATPCLKAFAQGKVAAAKMFPIIDRVPTIDAEATTGIKGTELRGQVRLNEVRFCYPGRTEVEILKGISLTIEPGKKIALVGESGCGKSTVMQLIERFYDTTSGELTIDGINIKDYNLKWLRQQIGYVGQEPVLFNTSIRENMLIANEKATDEEIYDALRKAKAYDFVMDQQEKLDTQVGTGGAKLSGGQKQRLAIARAILKNPSIYLLDEATSALDRTNEAIIQKTLEDISKGRTTIVIAHRLSTIKDSDIIYVVDQGRVIEAGNHDSLMSARGKYYALVQGQEAAAADVPKEELNPTQVEVKPATPPQQFNYTSIPAGAEMKLDQVVVQPNEQITSDTKKVETKVEEVEVPFSRLNEYSRPELIYTVFGVIGAAANGSAFPLMSIPLSGILNVLSNPSSPTYRDDANTNILIFVWIGIGAFFANILQSGMFAVVSDRLTWRLRTTLFNKMLRMNIGWHDEDKNQPGSLSAMLASDVQQVKMMSGEIVGLTIQSISSFITGMVIAFVSSWSLTLIALGLSPLIVISGRLQASMIQGFSADTDEAYKQSGSLISEAVNNMRTVASFGNEKKLTTLFDKMLERPAADATKKGHIAGFYFGMSQFTMFGMMAIIFYIGAIFYRDDGLSIENMYRTIFGTIMASFGAGQVSQFMPDVGAAKNAMKRIFGLLDSESKIDINKSGSYKGEIKGHIEFQNIHFKYPTRERKILNGLNLTIRPGEKIALVGPSGCGKSTIMQLLLRFYDPDQGRILVDGHDIREYDLKHLRQALGVVSQEPVLFNGTIEYNIKYTNENAADDFMRECARQANALDFIEKNAFQELPDQENKSTHASGSGFKREVGPKGSQISGGQKQRIAIARAIMKQPKIYLFDEATSALDNVSEKIVQESLNALMVGHTSVTIAHRLSTIRDSDQIHVLHNGEIIESGRYEELIQRKGTFYHMENGTLDQGPATGK